MLTMYVRAATWVAAQRDRARRDDQAAVSVEMAILIGVVAAAAIAVGTALTILVSRKIGEWSDI
jgi:Flp pilus assembly pilin Flp